MKLTKMYGIGDVLTAALDKVADQVGTFQNRGKAGWYLAVRAKGSSHEENGAIREKFKALGYSEFKGAYTKLISDMAAVEQAKAELTQFSAEHSAQLDMSGLETIASKLDPNQKPLGMQRETPAPVATDITPPAQGATPTDSIENMAAKVREDLAKSPRDEIGDVIGKRIEEFLEKLAGEVDEAKKQAFLHSFLEFKSKFWKYSFVNTMLIYFQSKGSATNVAGFERWKELGRQVQAGSKAIKIFAPLIRKEKGEGGEEKSRVYGFRMVNVFDFADTAPLQGEALAAWQKKNPDKMPFEQPKRDWWMSKENADTDQTKPLRDAAIEFAAEKGIEIALGADTGHAGGWAEGNNIAISYESKGARQLSTIVHEMAHELLHWAGRGNADKDAQRELREEGSKNLEVDAESVAYIVMKHFGFDASHAPNYLALHGAVGGDVRKRRDNISKAAKWIIEGMTKHVSGPQQPGAPAAAPQAQAQPAPEGADPADDILPAFVRGISKFAVGMFDPDTYMDTSLSFDKTGEPESKDMDDEQMLRKMEEQGLTYEQVVANFSNQLNDPKIQKLVENYKHTRKNLMDSMTMQNHQRENRMVQNPGPMATSINKP